MMIFKSKKNAFSLPEVLVSIFIFVMLLAVVMVNYRKSENSNWFRLSAFDLEDSINIAQGMSMTGKKINDQIPGFGYGINIAYDANDKTTLNIFGNVSSTCNKIFNDNSNYSCGNSNFDLVYSVNELLKGVYVDYFSCTSTQISDNNMNIVFYPPKAQMKIFTYNKTLSGSSFTVGAISERSSCTIYLKSTKTTGTWQINVSTSTNQVLSSFIN